MSIGEQRDQCAAHKQNRNDDLRPNRLSLEDSRPPAPLDAEPATVATPFYQEGSQKANRPHVRASPDLKMAGSVHF